MPEMYPMSAAFRRPRNPNGQSAWNSLKAAVATPQQNLMASGFAPQIGRGYGTPNGTGGWQDLGQLPGMNADPGDFRAQARQQIAMNRNVDPRYALGLAGGGQRTAALGQLAQASTAAEQALAASFPGPDHVSSLPFRTFQPQNDFQRAKVAASEAGWQQAQNPQALANWRAAREQRLAKQQSRGQASMMRALAANGWQPQSPKQAELLAQVQQQQMPTLAMQSLMSALGNQRDGLSEAQGQVLQGLMNGNQQGPAAGSPAAVPTSPVSRGTPSLEDTVMGMPYRPGPVAPSRDVNGVRSQFGEDAMRAKAAEVNGPSVGEWWGALTGAWPDWMKQRQELRRRMNQMVPPPPAPTPDSDGWMYGMPMM